MFIILISDTTSVLVSRFTSLLLLILLHVVVVFVLHCALVLVTVLCLKSAGFYLWLCFLKDDIMLGTILHCYSSLMI